MMKKLWNDAKNDSYALFLEDDITLSPLALQYVSYCVRVLKSSSIPELFGCSLYTPRVNEISPTTNPEHPWPWTPDTVVGSNPIFLMQLPCSWGAVYMGRIWQDFKSYWELREEFLDFPAIPGGSRSSGWTQSWKRYQNGELNAKC